MKLVIRHLYLFSTALLFCYSSVLLQAQPQNEAGLLFLHTFDVKQYNAATQNWALAQTPDGLLYAGNNDGILQFDGNAWRLIPTLLQSTVRSLDVDNNGTLYVGAQREFGLLKPDPDGTLRFQSLLEHLQPEHRDFADVWQTLATSEGVYFLTSARLFRWHQGQIRTWEADSPFHVAFAVGDSLFVRQWGVGLLHLRGDTLALVPGGERFAQERVYVMLPYDERRILVGTRTQGLFFFDGARFTPFRTEADAFFAQHPLYHGTSLSADRFALAARPGGVVVIDRQGRLERLMDQASGLPDDMVNYVFEDRERGLWLGLNDGLARVEASAALSWFGEASGLGGIVQSITRHEGTLYVATTLGVYRLAAATVPGEAATFVPVSGISSEAFALSSAGGTLLAATLSGVYGIEDSQAQLLSEGRAFSLHRSKQDTTLVFVGLLDALGRLHYEAGQWRSGEAVAGVTGGEVRHLSEAEAGRLWLSLNPGGVLRLDFPGGPSTEAEVRRFDTSHGLPEGYTPTFEVDGRVVFGSDRGLLEPSGDTLFAAAAGFPSTFTTRAVSRLVEDGSGAVWVHADGKTDLLRRTPEGTYALAATALGRLPEGSQYALYPEDAAAFLWLGGLDGLVRYDGGRDQAYVVPFAALIRRVTASDSVLFSGAAAPATAQVPAPVLSYADNALRFAYAAPSFDDASRTRYRYWLEGFDESWSSWSLESRKDYTNLPEGDHVFRVQARNLYSAMSEEAAFAFTILPPWWRTWWAYMLYGLLLLGVVLGLSHVQNERLLRKERERAQMREAHLRAEAAELETRALKAENEAKELELQKARELKKAYQVIQQQNEENERLLLNILPEPIANRLKKGEETIADAFNDVTVIFSDIVHFTQLSSRVSAAELVTMLNDIFSAFDRLALQFGVEKIKTIGDAYMAVAGVPEKREDHAKISLDMALGMIDAIEWFNGKYGTSLKIRIGLNTGPVVAGVIGQHKFIYDLWGDTVNTANRMESHGIPGRIHVTAATYKQAKDYFAFEPRGAIEIKGKGEMDTYLLKHRREVLPPVAEDPIHASP